ncbi:MAG TPA: hypothetical protein PKW08_05240 [Flavobacteriaceae bacterium]|nr:hypothetical protein [Flavobacteriaceae bacterium]MCB9214039.1 hypothetical protein [Alteromonas sp.]HPF10816.1 hypothetical protein [Flavobacteriaceae bacterium]HQU20975.1 hypothetical protein [Flavobacteriaceae bacterium]HQU66283.1 hypothetical protein [Flavobacteriaceae bacterium]
MKRIFQKYFSDFYLRSGGYLPSRPFFHSLYPGDFFQVKNGEMVALGNIYRKGIIGPERTKFDYGVRLNPSNWNLSSGVTKPYSGREVATNFDMGEEFQFSKQVLAFKQAGSYLFKGSEPESVRIANWQDLQDELIIKLTQTFFSFRELYVVTECVTTNHWTLAIASDADAELEIATKNENFGLVDIFGMPEVKTIQSKNMEFYHREEKRVPSFFRAKKLITRDEKLQLFISELIQERLNYETWANDFFDYDFFEETNSNPQPRHQTQLHTSVLDMLQSNQLNSNTALQYFQWGDFNMDDIQKLFMEYGNE